MEDLIEYFSRKDEVMEDSEWKHSMKVTEPKLTMNEIYSIFDRSPLMPSKNSIRFADQHSAYDIRVHF